MTSRMVGFGLAFGLLAAPLTADAQQPAQVRRIGFLSAAPASAPLIAKALGLTIPRSVLLRADDVIQ